jgi:hypothetical protein
MDWVVATLPLVELTVDGVEFRKGGDLDREAVLAHLRSADPLVVVAAIGDPLHIVSGSAAYELWQGEVSPRLAEGDAVFLEEFLHERAYFASRWEAESGRVAVVFEQFH